MDCNRLHWATIASGLLAMCLVTGCSPEKRPAGLGGLPPNHFFSDAQTVDLCVAILERDTEEVMRLLANGAEADKVGKEGMTPLMWSLGLKNKVAFDELLRRGADPSVVAKRGITVFRLAAAMEDTSYLQSILANGGDPNFVNPSTGNPVLFYAIDQGLLGNVQKLVEAGADVNLADSESWSPVLEAAALNQYHIVHYLLEKGADPEYATENGLDIAYLLRNSQENMDPNSDLYAWLQRVTELLRKDGAIGVRP